MRLINVQTFEISEFYGLDKAPYAILSHTWGVEEVTFQDFQRGGATHLLGFRKIKSACRQARHDGLQYVWIDTCCIDKSSSAELSEAINSMYHWYSQAALCYAYLSDVISPYNGGGSLHDHIQRARWFTRGWTLQELIAPPRVIFFDANWTPIGTRTDLVEMISEMTHIPSSCLSGSARLSEFSVAARMSWASLRQCTRGEDNAYCLMGLFGVNMPPLYGEGGSRAFSRLQLEILKTTDDQSLLAWAPRDTIQHHGVLTSVLAKSPADFHGFGDIQIVSPDIRRPTDMTNIGLHIWLPLHLITPDGSLIPGIPEGTNVFQASLNCGKDTQHLVMIYLISEPQKKSSNFYYRCNLPLPQYGPQIDAEIKDIYIMNQPEASLSQRNSPKPEWLQAHSLESSSATKVVREINQLELSPRTYKTPLLNYERGSSILLESPRITQAITYLEMELYKRQVWNISGRTFIPEGTIEQILDEANIGQTLQVFLTSPLIQSQNSDELQSRKKIFVVLLLADLLKFIEPVYTIGIVDSLLPMPDPQRLSGRLLRSIQNEEEEQHWEIWKTVSEVFGRPSYVERFFFAQWRVLAPVIRGKDTVPHYSFTPNHILPFLPSESQTEGLSEMDSHFLEEQLRYGSFSEVRRVKIHPDHYDFGDYGVSLDVREVKWRPLITTQINNPNHLFAIKRLQAVDHRSFQLETKALAHFRRSHPLQIIQLLATYEVRNDLLEDSPSTYHLIFPWADGDLRYFWSAEQRYVGDPSIIPWLSEQCHQLAKAVAAIHEGYDPSSEDYPGESQHVFGRHGDIKPTNILWFPPPRKDKEANLGQLVLGDFGLAAFHRRDSRSNLTSTDIPRSMTYSAPEFVTREKVSRATDIWALGCIFLEFVTWYLEGAHAVNEEFPEIRAAADVYGIRSDTFFEVTGSLNDPGDEHTSRVKPEVSSWCLRLSENHNSSWYIRDFLALIMRMLDVEPKTRIAGIDVAETLHLFHRRCTMDGEYYQGKSQILETSSGSSQ